MSLDTLAGNRRWRQAMVIVTVAALVRLAFAAIVPVFPDEAYYWEWSRRLAPGYFDHPAGIALLIRAGTALAGANAIGIRLGAVIAGWVAAVATIATARRIGGNGATLRAALVITVMPLAAAGLLLATPDSPALATTAVALYCVVRALEHEPRSAGSLRWWAITGIALGAAFCSKYTSIFLPVGVVFAVLARADLRVRLREPGPYVACVVATLVFLPVLVWNAHHDWISFVFQVRHGLAAPQGSALVAAWKHEGDFFGGQAGLASPILFVMLIVATARALRSRATSVELTLAVVAFVTFGFFVYSGVRQRVEPNWPAPAYIPAIVLLATAQWGRAGERWLRAGIVFAVVLSLVIYAQAIAPILPLRPTKDPIARAYGWDALTHAADSVAQAASAETRVRTWLGGDRYQEAAELALHDSRHPTTFATNLSGRINQYELWPGFADVARAGDNLVLALDETAGPHDVVKMLAPDFGAVRRGPLVVLRREGSRGGEVATRRLWVLLVWRGAWPRAVLVRR